MCVEWQGLGKQPVGRALGSPSRQTQQLGCCTVLDEWQWGERGGSLSAKVQQGGTAIGSITAEKETPALFAPTCGASRVPRVLSAAMVGKRETRLTVNPGLTAKIECQSKVYEVQVHRMCQEWFFLKNITRKVFWDTLGSNFLQAAGPPPATSLNRHTIANASSVTRSQSLE